MIALISLLSAVTISILVGRIATQAFEMTGLSHEAARFQARSALTGTGFTTAEAESVMEHPVRRRILMVLMVLQSAGLVTLVSTFVLSFVDTGGAGVALTRAAILVLGLVVLWLLARSPWLEALLSRVIRWALERFTDLGVTDFFSLLSLQDDYSIGNLKIGEDSWLAGRTLSELSLPEEGVLVLGIQREDGTYVGAPRGRYGVHGGDTLVLYGRVERLDDLQSRMRDAAGEAAHRKARRSHEEDLTDQDQGELEKERARGSSESPS